MSEFFDYNKNNGMIYATEDGEKEGEIVIGASQDVQPIVDHMNKKRNGVDTGVKRGLWHYCSIPTVVELELLQKGINIYNKHHFKAVLKEINTNYPYLKATRRHHEVIHE